MRLEKIKNTQGTVVEINLDNLSCIEEQQYSNEVVLCFGGYFLTVDKMEYERIRELLKPTDFVCEFGTTEDPIKKFKEIVYRATHLTGDDKLQLLMQLENIK